VRLAGLTAALANAALVDRVKAAARSAGVASSDIRPGAGPGARLGFIGNETGDPALAALVQPRGRTETSTLGIRLAGSARLETVRKAVEEAGAEQVIGPL
jgi:hypothetical protein